jgi:YD repeat-containing protein
MKRIAIAFAFLSVFAPAVVAQQHPNQKKGFNANDVYQFNGLDTINAFNGNLTMSIPIGPSYSVGGGLSYGLTLFSNANLWEPQEHCHEVTPGICAKVCPRFGSCEVLIDTTFMYPHRRANAGLGWTLSLGRLYQPEHPAMPDQGHWTYESPDGADHVFEAGNGTKTVDGSYLRMTYLADDPDTAQPNDPVRKIEFTNGTVQIFQPPSATTTDYWSLRRITNGFSENYLKISYGTHSDYPNGLRWTLEDSHGRKHWIDFDRVAYDGEMRLLVKRVQLSRFHDDSSATAYSPATINFNYLENQTFSRGEHQTCTFHKAPGSPIWQTANVPVLSSVNLPDGLSFGFEYNSSGLNYAGVPWKMTLPTGGMIEWEYGPYYKPAASVDSSEEYYQISYGVYKRKLWGKLTNGTRAPLGTWEYEPSLDYELNISCDPLPELPIPPGYCNEFKNAITGPLTGGQASKTVHYFSVAKVNLLPPWNPFEYGLPFTKNVSDGSSQPRWLSSQVFGPSDELLRSNYVRYDSALLPSQVESSRVVYEDDGDKYMDSDSSDFDGFGRYRTVKKSGNMPNTPTRTTKTSYLPANGDTLENDSWMRGLYDSVIVEEDGKAARTDFCFDTDTGFLKKKRMWKDAAEAGSNDVLAVFESDTRGNVQWERYYGGDILPTANRVGNVRPAASVSTGDICDAVTGTLVYELEHTRVEPANGVNGSVISEYTGVDVNVSDITIDWRTGLVSQSRDTAGVSTSYEYDWAGRLTAERSAGRADTIYEYLSPTTDEIEMSRTMTGSTEPLPWSKFQIDAFGRVIRETSALPDGEESVRHTTYNALGWRTSVSEPNQPSALTLFDYDGLGRTTKVTLPDGSITDFEYSGDRLKIRKSRVWTGGPSDTLVSVTETYDGFGRLVSVAEPSGATSAADKTGAYVTTRYAYDLSDRLVEVAMNHGAAPVQRRLFDYDGRGFLRWESQPESGLTSYLYDARGHLATKLQGAAQSQFDLDYFYDAAGRLIRLEARNPLYGAEDEPMYRPMKTFEYSSTNELEDDVWDLSKGKLKSASRYNYSRARPTDPPPIYLITDLYQYRDLPGRKTGRVTTIDEITEEVRPVRTFTTTAKYNELDLLVSQEYPSCLSCGVPPADWDRDLLTRTYDAGRLKTLLVHPDAVTPTVEFSPNITYWPNGLRKELQHSNGTADIQTVGAMPRPSSISFTTGGPCVYPSIEQPFLNRSTGGPEEPLTLFVNATGTAPLFYKWFKAELSGHFVEVPGGVSASLPVAPMTSTSYRVTVTNPCGEVSATTDVGVEECAPPKTGILEALRQADNSWLLKASPMVSASPSFEWSSGGLLLGDEPTLALGVVSQTTTYSFTAADLCGSATATVTITVPLSMTTTDLVAQASLDRTKIMVTWPDVDGATEYRVFRRGSDGSSTEWLRADPWLEDTTAQPAVVYAYAASVSQGGTSNWSNSDLATRGTYIEAAALAPISVQPSDEMLRAVNAVRAVANWPPVVWKTILSPSDPIPETGESVVARQLLAARARMTEALQAIGVPVKEYNDHDIVGGMVKAAHINEVLQRVQ